MINQTLKIAIVEDEPLAAQNLRFMIESLLPNAQIVVVLDSVADSVEWFKANTANLVFMDIHLSDGSSFEIFDHVKINIPIIFTTAYDNYAIKAFKVNSIDYLLKPIKQTELQLALNKFNQIYQQPTYSNINEIAELFTTPRTYKKRFTVQAGAKIKTISISEIALFYVIDGNTFIFLNTQQHYDLSQSLEKLELQLNPDQFFRINRQMIINYDSIHEMYPLSKSRVSIKLSPDPKMEILVSFRKMPDFRAWLER